VLTAFPAGFRCALRIIGNIAGAALLLRAAGLLLLTAVRVLASLLAGCRGALPVVGEVSAAATVFLSHRESPLLLCCSRRCSAASRHANAGHDAGFSGFIGFPRHRAQRRPALPACIDAAPGRMDNAAEPRNPDHGQK
jgi:hypothetical protein